MPFERPEVPAHQPARKKDRTRRKEVKPAIILTPQEIEEERKRRQEDPNWFREPE